MNLELNTYNSTLRSRGVILYPTDTIWGLGCDATDEIAIEKIYHIKQRPKDKKFIILFRDIEMIKEYLKVDLDLSFFDQFIEPTTIVLDLDLDLPNSLKSDQNTWAIRIPRNEFCQAILTQFDKPIVSTSANLSGEPNPTNFTEISDEIKSNVDFIVDEKYDQGTGQASNIIQFSNEEWKKLR